MILMAFFSYKNLGFHILQVILNGGLFFPASPEEGVVEEGCHIATIPYESSSSQMGVL